MNNPEMTPQVFRLRSKNTKAEQTVYANNTPKAPGHFGGMIASDYRTAKLLPELAFCPSTLRRGPA